MAGLIRLLWKACPPYQKCPRIALTPRVSTPFLTAVFAVPPPAVFALLLGALPLRLHSLQQLLNP